MMVVTGAVLVLVTWVAISALVVGLGLGPSLLIGRPTSHLSALRTSIWLGLGLGVLLVLVVGLWLPLGGAAAGTTAVSVALLASAAGWWLAQARRLGRPEQPERTWGTVVALLITFGTVAAFQAVRALGPVTNYDTGMYHLGAIKYAAEYATIPGLANLFFPFGYSNSWFPVAAVLGNGPWDGIGYRLANGLLIVLVLLDVSLRLLERRFTWGTTTLLIGIAACFLPLIAIADFWVASPTSDTAIMLLTLIAVAYLADVLDSSRAQSFDIRGSAAVVVVTTGLMVSMRPTMIAFTAAALAVLGAVAWRRRPSVFSPLGLALLAGWAAVLAGVQIWRDVVLSGWLLYPLSVFSFNVPWLADDPTGPRDATLAAARDPLAPDHWQVAHSWDWIGPWLAARWSLWETYLFLIACALAAVAVLVAHRFGVRLAWHRVTAAAAPSAVAIVMWFGFSPPSYRFAFGPLFTLPIVVLAAALVALPFSSTRWARLPTWVLTGVAGVLLLTTGYSALARHQVDRMTENRTWALGSITFDYAVAPIPRPETTPFTTSRGLELQVPSDGSDQCWDAWPLCTWNPSTSVGLRGSSIQQGFVTR